MVINSTNINKMKNQLADHNEKDHDKWCWKSWFGTDTKMWLD